MFLSDILGSCPLLADERIGKVLPFSSTPALYSPSSANTRHFRRLLLGDESCFWHDAFSACKWFTRGWTLQELIAPKVLKFFGANWNFVGDREKLTETISKATNIDTDVLYGLRAISSVSAAQKMAWAAGRKTSRVEDQAYALLGLFGVNMPMLYGVSWSVVKMVSRTKELPLGISKNKDTFLTLLIFPRNLLTVLHTCL